MKTIQIASLIANDVAREEAVEGANFDNEIRALRDLELVAVAGGSDGVPVWGN